MKKISIQKHQELSADIMVVAGESSSDLHAAGVISSIKILMPDAKIFGMGGANLRKTGVDILVDSSEVASVMGFTEIFHKIPKLFKAYKTLLREAKSRKPKIALLVDFPDFNFLMGKALHHQGIRVIYFICPQIWAWRQRRAKKMKNFVHQAAVIFPFEEEFFFRKGLKATFVGHPSVDIIEQEPLTSDQFKQIATSMRLDPERPIVALLPGSRRGEIDKLFKPMLDAFLQVKQVRSDIQAVIPIADTVNPEWLEPFLKEISDRKCISIVCEKGKTSNALPALKIASLAVVASGTATVEATLSQVPFFVIYKMSWLTILIARFLVRGVKFFAMPNIMSGRKVVEELLQEEVTSTNIARYIERIFGDPILKAKIRNDLALLRKSLTIKPIATISKNALNKEEIDEQKANRASTTIKETAYDRVATMIISSL